MSTKEDWDVLCEMIGVQSEGDLKRTLHFARVLQAVDRGIAIHAAGEREKLLRFDRQVRALALRKSHGELNEGWSIQNSLEDLKALPALIKLNPSRLCTWYVQKLIGQIHLWSVDEDDDKKRKLGRRLAKKVGEAIALSAGRGRPPYVLNMEEARASYTKDLERVKKVWITASHARKGVLRKALVAEFADLNEKAIPPETDLCSGEANPSRTARAITAKRLDVSLSHLEKLLAKPRAATRPPEPDRP